MPNLELSDWLFLGGPIVLIIGILTLLKVSYVAKPFSPLPAKKPAFCFLPKYVISLPVVGPEIEEDLSTRLAQFGFREVKRNDQKLVFSRGNALGDFSIKIAKLVATATQPLSNPVGLKIEYGVAFGCAFDTGDLWKFCRELTEKVEETLATAKSGRAETGNPYQAPQN